MCYSAQIEQHWREYVRRWGADIDLEAFVRLYGQRSQGAKLRIPRVVDAAFRTPHSAEERKILALIEDWDAAEAGRLEREVFNQRKRLADAERKLALKSTRAAAESRRIATAKVASGLQRLADLRRTGLERRDARIFPGWYAPVLIAEGGRLRVKPMRYQCRPAGVPASYDRRYPGTYNARRDSLGRFWKGQFGHTHGILVATAFFENVSRHALERRELAPGEAEANVVLEFRPDNGQEMLIACLWSHWQRAGEADLLSFAAITDAPPPEVAAAGHDRCVVPLKPANVAAWLHPDPARPEALQAILDDRERPYFEHREAA
ncbi:SOS response-associated peptidase family protein [Dokdonella sp.]|uniref:SOS response-associated peptidase family protein n=1 Tax=Dokdonella sp. TaxID=2291710 RepID=UPI0031C3C9E8|nr:SOS response-associated peptidase family protein [Dokdonella sp.]